MQNREFGVITLRQAEPVDEAFLYQLYANSRADEISAWGWDSAQQEAFLSFQFRARQNHYSEYPNCDDQIILSDETPIGRILVSELKDEFILVDIALLASHRNAGIGKTLIRKLLEKSAAIGKVVRLSVEKNNRAQHLYRLLGFGVTGEDGMYFQMEWKAVDQEFGSGKFEEGK